MFQHTLDRADQVTAPDRRVTVVARTHQECARAQLAKREVGKVILQPSNRDTAAGVFLALTHVRARDPRATVVIYPSDHFVYPETRFIQVVRSAFEGAQQLKSYLFLLGVSPDGPEPEYGWIQPGYHLGSIRGHPVRAIEVFLEKPSRDRCRTALAAGALWNTLVLVGNIQTLWGLGWHCFPNMMPLFESYGAAVGTPREEEVLESIYAIMPVRNFSSDFLGKASRQIAVMELAGVRWSDWGNPERIVETLGRIGCEPPFTTIEKTAAS